MTTTSILPFAATLVFVLVVAAVAVWLPSPSREAAGARARPPAGALGQLLPHLPLGAVGWLLATRWSELPQRFPVHWNARMEADGWATRSLLGVFGPLAFGAAMVAFVGLVGWVSVRATRPGRPSPAALAGDRAQRRSMLRALYLTQWTMAVVFSLAGLLPLAHAAGRAEELAGWIVGVALALAFVAVPLYLLIAFWRRRDDYPGTDPGTDADDRPWKGGLVYWNPDDPSVFVAKRLGIGYTLNFARPAAWVALVVMVALPLLLAWLLLVPGG